MTDYQATAGQTYMPAQENTEIDVLPYRPLPLFQCEFSPGYFRLYFAFGF